MGRGVAYSTTEPAHLLNVRAEGMSAWAGEPDHFVKRFEQEGGERRGFAQRRLFGRYLGEILDEAIASGRTERIDETATAATRIDDGWRVQLGDDSAIEASALVLAVGNQEPEVLSAFAGLAPGSFETRGGRMRALRLRSLQPAAALRCWSARA